MYADLFFNETYSYHKCQVPRPQPIDFVLHFFDNKDGLFYVDVGANDGITWSNTFVLEKYLKWNGICIEPNPEIFTKLVDSRNCKNLNICISNEDGNVVFRSVHGYANMLSGILDFFEDTHIKRIDNDIKNHGGCYQDLNIRSQPLKNVCQENNVKNIDYLSIDCEGAEYEVLKSLDLQSFKPKLISIETEDDLRSSDNSAIGHLIKNGYKFETKVCGDSFFSLI